VPDAITQTNLLAPSGATPTLDRLPRRLADFRTLGEALDYAAAGAAA
jgi:fatty-acyl-CoA synthase